jgi:hypothetical protein
MTSDPQPQRQVESEVIPPMAPDGACPPLPRPGVPSSDETRALLDALPAEVTFGSARGGRRPAEPLHISVVRELTEADLPALRAPPPVAAPGQKLLQVKHTHHQLARLLALGCEQAEASLITGYSPSYISTLKSDPAFRELLAYYELQREQIFVDAEERMKSLGLSALDELQRRLETETDQWSRRELMELSELMLVKAKALAKGGFGGGTAAGSGVQVNVSFVQASAKPTVTLEQEPGE